MKFLHCSDIHLGKTLGGNRERYRDYFRAFSKVVDLALDEQVDFMIIAGDLFHRGSIAPSTLADTVEILEPLKEKGIPVYAIEGNHDLFHRRQNESWLHYLSRRGFLHLLRPVRDPVSGSINFPPFDRQEAVGGWIEHQGLSIYGIGYYETQTGKMLELTLESLPERSGIGIFHGGVWDTEIIKIGRVTSGQIMPLKERFRYVALGHGHKPYEVGDPEDGVVFAYNPGALEVVNREEAGYAGGRNGRVYLVEMDGDKMTVSHRQIPRRPYLNITVECDGADNFEELLETVENELRKVKASLENDENPVVMLDVSGRIEFAPVNVDQDKLLKAVEEILNPIYAAVSNDTSMFHKSSGSAGGSRNMEQVYRETILDLISEHPQYREKKEDILELVLEVKKLIMDDGEKDLDMLVDIIHEKRMKIDG